MRSILEIFRDKSLWLISISILCLFILVPYYIFEYSYIFLIIVVLIQLSILFGNGKGLNALVFAFSVMIPYVTVNIAKGITSIIPYIYVCFASIILLVIKGNRLPKGSSPAVWVPIVIILVSIYFSFANYSMEEFQIIIFFVFSTYGIYFISFHDSTTLKEFYCLLDLIVYITLFYTIQEFIMDKSPYKNVFDSQEITYQFRAKGLFGHPLLLSSILSLYFVALIIKGIIFRKWEFFNFLIVIPFFILAASRTSLIVIAASVLLYVILFKVYSKPRFVVLLSLVIIGLILFLPSYIDYLEIPIDRIQNADFSQRQASYSVAFNVFANNGFGIGLSRDALKSEISMAGSYQLNANYDRDFLIFDNAFLTWIAGYGVFSILFLSVYLKPLVFAFRFRSGNPIYFKSMVLLFFVWFLIDISFDTFFYFPINALYFILASSIIKDMIRSRVAGNKVLVATSSSRDVDIQKYYVPGKANYT